MVQEKPWQKVYGTPSQPIAECGGAHLSPQLHRKHKWEDCHMGWLRQRHEILSQKVLKAERARDMAEVEEHLPS
jgi:hypothetical protein